MFAALNQIPRVEAIAGVELGGCPLASAVSFTSFLKGHPLPALYIRKTPKDHGTKKLIEGDKSIRPGMPIALLEDVITTGGSTLKAAASLRNSGLNPGREVLIKAGLPLISLVTINDFKD
jgi:orotate phosphoribosyltransferase